MIELADFHALLPPDAPESFRLGPAVSPGCTLCKTSANHLAVLIRASCTGTSSPRRLRNLLYDPPRPLRVIEGKRERTETLASLVCTATEPKLQEAFLRVVKLVLSLSGRQTEDDLEIRIDELVDLFEAIGRPGSTTVQGLWAELAIILWSSDPVQAVSSWRSRPSATHDFESNQDRLEVKSAVTGLREHDLSLDQLVELPGGRTLLASCLLKEATDGATVADLVRDICMRVSSNVELERRMHRITMKSLGADWERSAVNRYSVRSARQELQLYEALKIPAPARPTPVEVKQVRFRVDLSSTDPFDLRRARRVSPFFRAVLPDAAGVSVD